MVRETMPLTTVEPGVYVYGTACLPRFDNATMTIAREQDGVTQWFPISATCAALGLDAAAQRRALARDEVLTDAVRDVPFKTAAGWRMTTCLPRKEWVRWLAQMDPRRVKGVARDRLREFQDDVLAEADRLFFSPRGHTPPNERGVASAVVRVEVRMNCFECGAPHYILHENGKTTVLRIRAEE